jgi:hypothetical protein
MLLANLLANPGTPGDLMGIDPLFDQ